MGAPDPAKTQGTRNHQNHDGGGKGFPNAGDIYVLLEDVNVPNRTTLLTPISGSNFGT